MVEEARGILKTLEATIPGLAMVRLRRVNLERRHGNLEEAETLLKEAMEQGRDVTEMSFYAVKLARHVMKVQKDPSKAKKILLEALERDPVRNGEEFVFRPEDVQCVGLNLNIRNTLGFDSLD